jgi:hypothetical protein
MQDVATAGNGPADGAAVSLRRAVNWEIWALAVRSGAGSSLYEFVCECGDEGCDGVVPMTAAEFVDTAPGQVRAH